MHQRIHNFGAGPAALPLSVLEEAQRDLLSLPGVGMSVLEISHRSGHFSKILDETEHNLKTLLGLSPEQHVLFLPGGASTAFTLIPMNFKVEGRPADYVVTGSWSSKAAKDAEALGAGRRIWEGKAENYVRVPRADELNPNPDAAYLHVTSNETIHGVQFQREVEAGDVPLVCDMSSDFLSRPIDASRYSLIYAGAQKNAGPAGVTIVIAHDRLLERSAEKGLLPMLSYALQVKERSIYNTPPVFPIYIVMLVTRWLMNEKGGLLAMAAENEEKAALLYTAIDGSGGFYRPHAEVASRSRMNVTWRLPSEELEKTFLDEAKKAGFDGLKGHRSVGGIRASIYNAVDKGSVRALASFMENFSRR